MLDLMHNWSQYLIEYKYRKSKHFHVMASQFGALHIFPVNVLVLAL